LYHSSGIDSIPYSLILSNLEHQLTHTTRTYDQFKEYLKYGNNESLKQNEEMAYKTLVEEDK